MSFTPYFTRFRVAQDARVDNVPARREQINQIFAGHLFWHTSDIQIGAFDTVTAWPR